MQIQEVALFRIHGRYEGPPFPFAGWQIHPTSLYGDGRLPDATPRLTQPRDLAHAYVEIRTDVGATGLYGPVDEIALPIIGKELSALLKGRDPLASEMLLDLMLRHNRHGRSGIYTIAVSALDLALWDLKGKVWKAPVFRLLGGPTRSQIPAYASMLGFSDEPEAAALVAREYQKAGYSAQKWFFRCGPVHGTRGMERNVAMASAVREAVGPSYPLMFDAFMSWDASYTREVLRELAPLKPRWLEEPLPPERLGALRELRNSGVPIASGEHVYTRWQTKELLSSGAVDVLQNDPDWTGGLTESIKIAALASAFEVPFVPHGHQLVPALHLAASQSPATVPMVEYLVQLQDEKQWFHRPMFRPENGVFDLPDALGLGFTFDETKIQRREEIVCH